MGDSNNSNSGFPMAAIVLVKEVFVCYYRMKYEFRDGENSMKIEQYQLSNGMNVILEPISGIHSVAFGVWVKVGSVDENKENNGIAHMIEHMIFKGTSHYSAKQIADMTAEIGGNLDAYTSKECTSFYGWVLKENLSKTICLLADMLKNSLFKEEDLENEKDIVKEEIDMYNDSAEDVVHEMLQKCIWKEHPLGYLISGEKEVIENFTSKDLKKFHHDYYTAENMLLSLAGNFDVAEIKKELEEAFGTWKAKGKQHNTSIPIFTPCLYTQDKDIEQLHLNIAYDSISSVSEERYAFSILNAILGGGANSRLFLKVREEMGIAYAIYSYGSSFFHTGLFHIYAGLNANRLEETIEVIQKEILKLKKEGPTKEEMLWAKEQIKTDLIIHAESTKGHMSSNARELMQFGKAVPLEETLHQINQVKREDILDCLEKYFRPEKMAIAFAGNLEQVSAELKTWKGIQNIIVS